LIFAAHAQIENIEFQEPFVSSNSWHRTADSNSAIHLDTKCAVWSTPTA